MRFSIAYLALVYVVPSVALAQGAPPPPPPPPSTPQGVPAATPLTTPAPASAEQGGHSAKDDHTHIIGLRDALRVLPVQTPMFDGAAMTEGTAYLDFYAYVESYVAGLNSAIGLWNAFPDALTRSDEARMLRSELDRRIAFAKALDSAERIERQKVKAERDAKVAAEKAAAEKAGTALCDAFAQELTKFQEPMRNLASLLKQQKDEPDGITFKNKADWNKHMRAARRVETLCMTPEYEGVGTVGCDAYRTGDGLHDPLAWCEAAERADELLVQGINNRIADNIRRYGISEANLGAIAQGSGWLNLEGPVFAERFFAFDRKEQRRMTQDLPPLFRAAELGPPQEHAAIKEQGALRARLRAKVLELLPTFKAPEPGGALAREDDGLKVVRRAVKKWSKGAKVLDAYMVDNDWQERKDSAGRVIARTIKGFVVLKMPGDSICQGWEFGLRDEDNGRGRLKKAKEPHFLRMTFLGCPGS